MLPSLFSPRFSNATSVADEPLRSSDSVVFSPRFSVPCGEDSSRSRQMLFRSTLKCVFQFSSLVFDSLESLVLIVVSAPARLIVMVIVIYFHCCGHLSSAQAQKRDHMVTIEAKFASRLPLRTVMCDSARLVIW